jgi:hypothetical protein
MLDLRFGTVLTPVLLPMIYRGVTALAVILGLAAVVGAALQAWWLGLLAAVVVPVAVAVVIGLTRIACELLWYVNELHEDVDQISERFARLEGKVDELAADMPKLNFLRRGAATRYRPAPDSGERPANDADAS